MFCIKGIFTNNNDRNDPDEANNNLINSIINPTYRQRRVNSYKGDSKTSSRSSYHNKDIKYRNNNKEERKKAETTVKNKRDSRDNDSTDKEDNDRMPGLPDHDSSSEDDGEYNRRDNDPSINTCRNIITEWLDNDNNHDEYNRDSDEKEEEDEIYRRITKHPAVPLQVQGGDGILQIETVIEKTFRRLSTLIRK